MTLKVIFRAANLTHFSVFFGFKVGLISRVGLNLVQRGYHDGFDLLVCNDALEKPSNGVQKRQNSASVAEVAQAGVAQGVVLANHVRSQIYDEVSLIGPR